MKRIFAIVLLAGMVCAEQTFFVAPDGDDKNSGTKRHPFATLERSLQAVESAKKTEPITVYLRDGSYPQTKPLVFTPAISGTKDAPVSFKAYRGEKPVISGGHRLTGTWTQTPGKPFFQMDLPDAKDSKWVFFSLYVNGESRTRARTPNWGKRTLRGESTEPGGDPRKSLRYYAGDFDPSWTNPTDIDVVLLCSWTPTLHRITEVVPEKRSVRFESTHFRTVDFWERKIRYYLSNVYEGLDEPGEWYLNRKTGVLYYYPMPGEDLAKAEIVAPVLKSRLIEFQGDLEQRKWVEHVRFEGVGFRYVDGDMDKYNGMYRQGHMYLGAVIVAKGLRNAAFEGCEFSQLGEYGFELADGCRDVTIRQCHFWDLGAGAIQTGVSDLKTLQTPVVAADPDSAKEREVLNLVIDNNCIHRTGTIWHGCYGIVNRFASFTQITHNEIYDTHYTAIGLDARWDWRKGKYSHGNVVAYNNLHNLGLGYHSDGAAVYQFGPLDTHIHHNIIRDTRSYPYICGYAGVYLDQQSRGACIENNLIYNVDWYAIRQNGDENTQRNNLCAFARDGFLDRRGLEDDINYTECTRNIYIASNNVTLVASKDWKKGIKLPVIQSNLYYTIASDGKLDFDGRTVEEWEGLGFEKDIVIGNPGCRNPAAFDFSLSSDSFAAKKIGFVPFDKEIKKAGLYGDSSWRRISEKYPARKPQTVFWTRDELAVLDKFSIDPNDLKDGDPAFSSGVGGQDKTLGFFVTSEIPGVRGPKCIKCVDGKAAPKSFYPMYSFSPHKVVEGTVALTFAARLPVTNAVGFSVCLRGKNQSKDTALEIFFEKDGVIRTDKKGDLGRLIPGEWTAVKITFGLGTKRDGNYTVALRDRTGERKHTFPFSNATFDELKWFGFIAGGTTDGCFYLDNLKFTFD